MTARRVAAAALGLLLCGACGPSFPPDAEVLSDDVFIQSLQPGLWRHVSHRQIAGQRVGSNGLVVKLPDGALLVDTAWDDAQTALLLDWVERELGSVTLLLVSHAHDDRMGGIAEVHRRGIPSLGLVQTGRLAEEQGFEPLTQTFAGRIPLDPLGVRGEAFFPGPGHSRDNLVVWLEGSRTLFGTCLVRGAEWGIGFLGDAAVEAWPKTARVLEERYARARRVVPGHGEPGDRSLLVHTRELADAAAAEHAAR